MVGHDTLGLSASLCTRDGRNGIGWTASFDTAKAGPTNVRIAFRDLLPTKYANVVPPPLVGTPPALNAGTVHALQVITSKRRFCLLQSPTSAVTT
jgi:hypothetical protein